MKIQSLVVLSSIIAMASISAAQAARIRGASLDGVAVCTFDSTCPNEVFGSLTLMADNRYACAKRMAHKKFAAVLLESGSGKEVFSGALGEVSFSDKGVSFVSKTDEGKIRFSTDAAIKKGSVDMGDGPCTLKCEPIEVLYECGR